MILNLYCMKNRLSGMYEKPFAEIYDSKEYSEFLAAALAQASPADLVRHKEFDLYRIGAFDTKLGKVVEVQDEFICSLEQLCVGYLKIKEGDKDARETN